MVLFSDQIDPMAKSQQHSFQYLTRIVRNGKWFNFPSFKQKHLLSVSNSNPQVYKEETFLANCNSVGQFTVDLSQNK